MLRTDTFIAPIGFIFSSINIVFVQRKREKKREKYIFIHLFWFILNEVVYRTQWSLHMKIFRVHVNWILRFYSSIDDLFKRLFFFSGANWHKYRKFYFWFKQYLIANSKEESTYFWLLITAWTIETIETIETTVAINTIFFFFAKWQWVMRCLWSVFFNWKYHFLCRRSIVGILDPINN